MSVRRLAEAQPPSFDFTPENHAWAEKEISKYPPGRQASAVLALLWRAQKQSGYWLPKPAIEKVAEILDMPKIRVLEVATFYTMFNLEPVGSFYVQLCGTTPCMLQGAESLKAILRKRVGGPDHVSADGLFSWTEVECLGACCNAPMVQINDDYYEDLTPENFAQLLDDLAAGRPVKTGSQIGRVSSEPVGGLTALTSLYGADGRSGPESAPQQPANDERAPKAGNDPGPAGRARVVYLDPAAANPGARAAAESLTVSGSTPEPILRSEADANAKAAAEEALIREALAELPQNATSEQKADAVGVRPLGIPAARGAGDDLQRIKGVDPVNERRLHELGVFRFDQIAAWTRAEIRWVGTYLDLPGRIDREQWVAQAANFVPGGTSPKGGGAGTNLDATTER